MDWNEDTLGPMPEALRDLYGFNIGETEVYERGNADAAIAALVNRLEMLEGKWRAIERAGQALGEQPR